MPTISDDADFIRHSLKSAYRFTEHRVEAGMSEFVFAAGQPCFRASTHKVDIERTPIFRRGKDVPYFTRTGKQLYLTDPRYFESGRVEPHQWLDELHEATDMNIQEV